MHFLRPNIVLSTDDFRFSIQPLTILGVTGPFSVLAENIYKLCIEDFKVISAISLSFMHLAWY